MTNSARLSGRPSSSAAYNVGDVVDTPDSAIKSWRYLGAGEWEPNDAVRYTTGPGGGVRLSLGSAGAALPVLLQTPSLAFIGDSRSRYGYRTWYYSATAASGTAGFRVDLLGCGPDTKLTASFGAGTVEWDAATRALRWTAPGDTAGPWVAFERAAEYKLESGSPRQWLRARFSSATPPAASASFAVNTTGDGRPLSEWQSHNTDVCSRLNLHQRLPLWLGAGGAHTADCVELLGWYEDMASGPGVDVIRVGTNDITSEARTLAQITELAYQLFDARRALGRKLVIVGENARWGTAVNTGMTASQIALLHGINAAYRSYALTHYADCRFVDLFSISHDPAYSDARPKSGILKDTLHDDVAGAILFGGAISAAVQSLGFRAEPPPMPTDSASALTAMLGTGGTAGTATTGAVPDGWQVRRLAGTTTTIVSSIVGYPEKEGRRIEVEITNTDGATNNVEIGGLAVLAFADFGCGVGDSLEMACDVEVVSGTVTQLDAALLYNGSSRRSLIKFPVVAGRYFRACVPAEIVAADTSLRMLLTIVSGTGTAVVRAGGFLLRKAQTV